MDVFFRLWATTNILFIDFIVLYHLIGSIKNGGSDDDDKK